MTATCGPTFWTILSSLLTPVIAVVVAGIAYRQWRTAQDRLRLDLFDRRLAIHAAALEMISSVFASGKVVSLDWVKLANNTRQARWLLSQEMQSYFDNQLLKKAGLLQSLDLEFASLSDDDTRKQNLQQQRELREWILTQREVVDREFDKFLRMPR